MNPQWQTNLKQRVPFPIFVKNAIEKYDFGVGNLQGTFNLLT
jgi:hypothetical protein